MSNLLAGDGITFSWNGTTKELTISATAGDSAAQAETIRDTIGSALVSGSGITIVVDDSGNTITLSLTTEVVQDLIGAMLTDSSSVDFTYDDPSGTLTAVVILEWLQDTVAAMITGGSHTNLTATYQDAGGVIDLAASGGSYGTENAQDDIGTILVDSSSIDFTYNDATPSITASVILEWLQDTIAAMFTGGTHSGASFAYDDSGGFVNITVTGGGGGSSVTYDDFASRPSAGTAGAVFVATDRPIIDVDDGTLWQPMAEGILPWTPPVSGDFAWVNQGGASIDTSLGGVRMTVPIGAGANWRYRKKTIPSAPYTVTVYLWGMMPGYDHQVSGLVLRDSGSGKIVNFGQYMNSSGSWIALSKWDSPSSYNSDYDSHHRVGSIPRWLRIRDDNTNRFFEYSFDGIFWIQRNTGTIGRTDFITPDEIGWGGDHEFNSGSGHLIWLLSWAET